MSDDKLKLFIPELEIQGLVQQIADRINVDFADLEKKSESLIVIVTLKGAIYFAADLLRKLKVPIKVDFVRCSSYGSGTQSSGTISITKDTELDVAGQSVIILDEIVDSGRTLSFLVDRLLARSPKVLLIAALLSKPSRREVPVTVDYCGKEVEDKFLVGYGLDYNENHRHLKDIYFI